MKDIAHFIEGFARFKEAYFSSDSGLFEQLKEKQSPKVMLIGCSDSRVDPALLLGGRPGDLFVVRNVANLVPPYERDGRYHGVSAALEFAVRDLEVEHIVVLGHSSCGGIHTLLTGSANREFLGKWMRMAAPARKKVLAELQGKSQALQARSLEQAAVLLSLKNLATFPWVKDRVKTGALHLHGWYFDLNKGELWAYDPAKRGFARLCKPLID